MRCVAIVGRRLLDNVLQTVLIKYKDYFGERFVGGLSIRKYADAHQLNLGSVGYLYKKFFSAFARPLKELDKAEGNAVCGNLYKMNP